MINNDWMIGQGEGYIIELHLTGLSWSWKTIILPSLKLENKQYTP